MTLDLDALPTELTIAEKAALTSGSGIWFTMPVDRLGILRIMTSDGPHGRRAQAGEGDHVGLGGSLLPDRFGGGGRAGRPRDAELVGRWRRQETGQ